MAKDWRCGGGGRPLTKRRFSGTNVLGPPQMHGPLTLIETPPALACLHCASTQATVWRQRAIAGALLGYTTNCVCCDPETGNACPQCGSQNLAY